MLTENVSVKEVRVKNKQEEVQVKVTRRSRYIKAFKRYD